MGLRMPRLRPPVFEGSGAAHGVKRPAPLDPLIGQDHLHPMARVPIRRQHPLRQEGRRQHGPRTPAQDLRDSLGKLCTSDSCASA